MPNEEHTTMHLKAADRERLIALGERFTRPPKDQLTVILDEWCRDREIRLNGGGNRREQQEK